MTEPKDMTDNEMAEALAIEVMGWHRTPGSGWEQWYEADGSHSGYLQFYPLEFHGDMALCRKKMREMGFYRHAIDVYTPQQTRVGYIEKGRTWPAGESRLNDELKAEAIAMLQAVRAKK